MSDIILLDSGIAGGLLSNTPSLASRWQQLITDILPKIPNGKIAVPTPVWFELAQWAPEWHKKIQEEIANRNSGHPNPLYEFAGYSITNSILMDAALYRCCCRSQQNTSDLATLKGDKEKISFIDSIIAAYCLKFGYYLLTLNQQDFPEKFFELKDTQLSPRGNQLNRQFACLLKPKISAWQVVKANT